MTLHDVFLWLEDINVGRQSNEGMTYYRSGSLAGKD